VNEPWLSVIMPTYNGAAYLADTLASIHRQSDKQIEVIAVDDGSSDDTLAILNTYANWLPLRIIARIRVGNWVANTNVGLNEARGKYVCFLHQDDLWLPGRLRTLRRLVHWEPQAALYCHASRYSDSSGRGLGVWRSPLPVGRSEPQRVVEQLLVQNFLAVPAPLFTRAAALGAGGMDENLWYTADWDLWLKLASAGTVVYHPAPLAAFRLHPQSQTAQGVARASDMHKQCETVLQRHLPRWEAANPGRSEIGQAARMSVEVNHALAACAYGDRPRWLPLAARLLALGPAGSYRYFRDSRIVERVAAQVRARTARAIAGKELLWRSRPSSVGFSPRISPV
jgi:hypothetical protein